MTFLPVRILYNVRKKWTVEDSEDTNPLTKTACFSESYPTTSHTQTTYKTLTP